MAAARRSVASRPIIQAIYKVRNLKLLSENRANNTMAKKSRIRTASIGLGAVELMLQVYLLELYILAGLKPSLAGLAIAAVGRTAHEVVKEVRKQFADNPDIMELSLIHI